MTAAVRISFIVSSDMPGLASRSIAQIFVMSSSIYYLFDKAGKRMDKCNKTNLHIKFVTEADVVSGTIEACGVP